MILMVEGLPKRINRAWRQVLASQIPVLQQLFSMFLRPFGHELLGATGQPARDQLETVDVERGLIVAVGGVEVRPALVLRPSKYIQITIP